MDLHLSARKIWQMAACTVFLSNTLATHFRGGTISWEPLGGYKVEFNFKMGWTYGAGPGCTESKIGDFVDGPLLSGRGAPSYWKCTEGCSGTPTLHASSYNCMAANKGEGWEQGQMTFDYTFPSAGPFVVSFEGKDWMKLGDGKGGGPWRIATTVDLRSRSDTQQPNGSPETLSQAIYYMQFECHHELQIPVVDPDGDKVRCEWAAGDDCKAVCNALPGARLDQDTCTIVFNSTSAASFEQDQFYAVALTIRDYPQTTISLGGSASKTPSDSLSSVPIQFLIQTPTFPVGCEDKPRFVSPSPADGSEVLVQALEIINITVAADNSADLSKKISTIDVLGPVDLRQSSLSQDPTRTNTFQKTLTWATSEADVGTHIVCARAVNERRKTGDPRCFTIEIVADPCDSQPCQHGATCTSSQGNFTCSCVAGYTGGICEIDIDECESAPCLNAGVCYDLLNNYVCICVPGFTDKNCATDVDDCVSDPCMHGGTCTDQVNDFTCMCPPDRTGKNCHIGVDFCETKPCFNGGTCHNSFAGFTCECLDGWQGSVCDYRAAISQRSTCTGSKTSKLGTPEQEACCQATEYSDCKCFVSPHVEPEDIGMDPPMRDLLCALIAFPIGLGLSLLTWNIMLSCSRSGPEEKVQNYRQKHPPTRRCNTRTQTWLDEQAGPMVSPDEAPKSTCQSPIPPQRFLYPSSPMGAFGDPAGGRAEDLHSPASGGSSTPMNTYRASLNAGDCHSAAPQRRADTHRSQAMGWSNF